MRIKQCAHISGGDSSESAGPRELLLCRRLEMRLLLECERGRLAIKAVGSFILACCSDSTVEFGMLKAKILALHTFLQPPLSQIS